MLWRRWKTMRQPNGSGVRNEPRRLARSARDLAASLGNQPRGAVIAQVSFSPLIVSRSELNPWGWKRFNPWQPNDRGQSLLLPRQLICGSIGSNQMYLDRAVQLPGPERSGRMPECTGGSGFNELVVVAAAGQCDCWSREMPGPTSIRSTLVARLTLIRNGIEIAVDASQQIDQDLSLVLSQAGEQPALALERRHDHRVMDLPSLRRERDRVAAAVARVGLDCDQVAALHHGQGAAHRPLVEADDVTNARGGNARLDREQRHDPPLGDIDAEALLVERRGAARQLVGNERDECGHVALEIERLASPGAARSCRLSRRAGRSVLTHVSHHPSNAVEK